MVVLPRFPHAIFPPPALADNVLNESFPDGSSLRTFRANFLKTLIVQEKPVGAFWDLSG
jgi:hypothetical protein